MRYSSLEITDFYQQTVKDGFCILKKHISPEKIRSWNEAFKPLLEDHIRREGHLENRGPGRYYVTLPFDTPFADEEVFCDPEVLAIVEKLVGADFTMVQLATDTPIRGSDYQEIHRDTPPLFPEWGQETPPFQLAVNFPLIDVTAQNGPFEVARGTHMFSKEESLRRITSGENPLEPVCLAVGDVMIRDVRGLHRGTPNMTDEPRPMVVIGYSRKWLFRPEVSIRIPKSVWENLSLRSRHMLRHNPVVESIDSEAHEIYQSFSY